MIEIEAPDGSIIEFPDGTSDADIINVMSREYAPKQPRTWGQLGGDVWEGVKSGFTSGFGDELQAGIAAGSVGLQNLAGVDTNGLDASTAYTRALESLREEQAQARERSGGAFLAGEIGGGALTAMGLAGRAPAATAGIQQYASRGLPQSLGTAAGIGAVSGGVYGFGSGEGGAAQRLQNAGEYGIYGGLGGVAGAGIGRGVGSLASRAAKFVERRKPQATKVAPTVSGSTADQTLNQLVQATQDAQELTYNQAVNSKAMNQVTQAIKQDYPDNYEQVLNVWKESNQPLAAIAGPALTRKATGAAQYESALPKTVSYFKGQSAEATDKALQSVYKNLGDSKSYFLTIDDILAKGRAKADPLYRKAETQTVTLKEIKPEVQEAIKQARREYPSELKDLPDNSIKVLDYAKRAIDDQISAAERAGQNNFARSRTSIKKELLSEIDAQSPDYAKARAIAGDYLSLTKAMDTGRAFDKADPQEIASLLKKATAQEKEAFKLGFSKKLADTINNVSEGKNPYDRVFGGATKQERLRTVLNADEYRKLETDMKAMNRLFDMQRTVLGGSPTVTKAMAAAELSNDDIIGAITQPKKKFMDSVLKKIGMGDKVASSVADLLYETDPTKKLVLLERVAGKKDFTQQEKQLVKEYYFDIADKLRLAGASVGGQTIPEATIRAQDYKEQQ